MRTILCSNRIRRDLRKRQRDESIINNGPVKLHTTNKARQGKKNIFQIMIPVLVGFGKNYFNNFGPATRSHLNHNQEDGDDTITTVPSYQFTEESPAPPWEQEDDPLIDVHCTTASTYFLTRSGKIYNCGTIHGIVRPSLTKISIALPLKCVQLATGRQFCLARMEGGLAVCAWGAGHFGQLGLSPFDENDNTSSSSSSPPSFVHHPTVVEGLLPHVVGAPISSVAAGYWHSMALTQEGKVFMWGCNRNGQCAKKPTVKDPPTILRPQLVTFDNTSSSKSVQSSSNTKNIRINKIVAGRSHSVALDDGGQCYCWGANHYGQCGILTRRRVGGVTTPKHVEALAKVRIVDISAGDVHTLALTGGGRVFGWGGGFDGQLGSGFIYNMNPKPKLVSDLDFVAIEAGREWKSKQKEKNPQQQTDQSLQNNYSKRATGSTSVQDLVNTPRIISVTAKGNSSFAVSSTGHVYAWGCNDVGNLGLPKPDHATLTYSDPVQVLSKTPSQRQFQTYSFDSSHNVALPQRLDSLRHLDITKIGVASTFIWCLGTMRQENGNSHNNIVGRTLYEVEEAKRQKTTRVPHERILHSLETGSFAMTIPNSSNPTDVTSEAGKQQIKKQPTTDPLESNDRDESGYADRKRLDKEGTLVLDMNSRTETKMDINFHKKTSDSHDSISSPKLASTESFHKENDVSQTSSTVDKISSVLSSPSGKKKRLFSPKKIVKGIVRLASVGSLKSEPATSTDEIDAPKNKR